MKKKMKIVKLKTSLTPKHKAKLIKFVKESNKNGIKTNMSEVIRQLIDYTL